jgi:hypothetical protein
MADKWIRPDLAHMSQRRALANWFTLARWAVSAAVLAVAVTAIAPRADFDSVAYLANIMLRPAYTSATADQYPILGYSMCDKVSRVAECAEDQDPYLTRQGSQ